MADQPAPVHAQLPMVKPTDQNRPVVSWQQTARVPVNQRGALPTTANYNTKLYQWGPLQFEVWPLNVHEFDHQTGTEWAHKLVVGAPVYREYTGEDDETINFRGRIFPYRIGGMSELELLNATRRAGIANLLIRGDGVIMGWYVCEKLMRSNKELSAEGVGQVIEFEADFARIPSPEDGASYLSQLWGVGYISSE
jgi:phage protein U